MTGTRKTASVSEVDAARQAAIDAAAVADAANEAAAAAAKLVTSCVEAIRTGQDQNTTAADLVELRGHADWAQHRADAARAAAEAAHAEEGRLVHDAAIVEARKILADNSAEALAGQFSDAVDALVEFVHAYQRREQALADAMRVLSAGNVEFDDPRATVRSFEGTALELPGYELVRSVLDVTQLAHARLVNGKTGTGPIDEVLFRINNPGDPTLVRQITEGAKQ